MIDSVRVMARAGKQAIDLGLGVPVIAMWTIWQGKALLKLYEFERGKLPTFFATQVAAGVEDGGFWKGEGGLTGFCAGPSPKWGVPSHRFPPPPKGGFKLCIVGRNKVIARF